MHLFIASLSEYVVEDLRAMIVALLLRVVQGVPIKDQGSDSFSECPELIMGQNIARKTQLLHKAERDARSFPQNPISQRLCITAQKLCTRRFFAKDDAEVKDKFAI
jgi:hypothetical protein